MTTMLGIELGDWTALRADASRVRHEVFVVEQGVPAELELDEDDAQALHALARDAHGQAQATGRLLPDAHIGRIAVRAAARGQGAGAAILRALVEAARARGDREVWLHAQTHATGFYEKYGFAVYGTPFMEAGIAHIEMRCALRADG